MLQKIKSKLQAGSFLHSVITVASGTVIAQIIAVLLSPIITRMYTPEDMGILASYTAIVGILGVIAAGRYELAVVLPKTAKESNAVVLAGLIFSVVYSAIITLVAIIFKDRIIAFFNLKGAATQWVYFLGVFVFLIGMEILLKRLAIKNKHFKVLASTEITQQISNNSIKIGWGYFSPTAMGLLVSYLFSTLARVVRLGLGEFKIVFSPENRPSLADAKQAAVRYKKFPLINSWAAILNEIVLQLPVILFTALFSPAIAGFYTLSHRMIKLPLTFIGGSVSSVFMEKAAANKDNTVELGRLSLELYSKMILISAMAMSVVTFYGDLLFPWVFGAQWLEAGRYAQVLSLWVLFSFSSTPISIIFTIKELQKDYLIWIVFRLTAVIISLYISFFLSGEPYTVVFVFAVTNALISFLYAHRVLAILKVSLLSILTALLKTLIPIYLLQGILSLVIRKYLTMAVL